MDSKDSSRNNRLSKEEQNDLLVKGNFEAITAYLQDLIGSMMSRYAIKENDRDEVRRFMSEAVLYAADLFLQNEQHTKARFLFPTYYVWFGKQILEEYEERGFQAAKAYHDGIMRKWRAKIRAGESLIPISQIPIQYR